MWGVTCICLAGADPLAAPGPGPQSRARGPGVWRLLGPENKGAQPLTVFTIHGRKLNIYSSGYAKVIIWRQNTWPGERQTAVHMKKRQFRADGQTDRRSQHRTNQTPTLQKVRANFKATMVATTIASPVCGCTGLSPNLWSWRLTVF